MDGAEDGGFEAAKGKIKVGYFWNRKSIFSAVAVLSRLSNGWVAGVGEAKNLGDFVETFADSIISSSANNFEVVVTLHIDDLSMAAGYNGGEEWKFWLMAAKPIGINVGFKMMSGIKRDVV